MDMLASYRAVYDSSRLAYLRLGWLLGLIDGVILANQRCYIKKPFVPYYRELLFSECVVSYTVSSLSH